VKASLATLPAKVGQPNEDFAGLTPTAAVLLDGAGLSGTETRCRHGVAWYSRKLGGGLLHRLVDDDGADIQAILADAIDETAESHRDTCDLEDPGTPSATVLIARLRPERVEYLVLADSVLVVEKAGGESLVLTDDREAQVGRSYRAEMDQLENGTPAHDDARRRYVQALRPHRNQPSGFWVAAADPKAADQAITGSFALDEISALALLSDGASRLADRFRTTSWPELMSTLRADGPSGLLRAVRAAEESDPLGRRWPRGKTFDDATAIYWSPR
jgi:hypothetical protein